MDKIELLKNFINKRDYLSTVQLVKAFNNYLILKGYVNENNGLTVSSDNQDLIIPFNSNVMHMLMAGSGVHPLNLMRETLSGVLGSLFLDALDNDDQVETTTILNALTLI